MTRLLLVVGAPRSGTTLATRLIRELPGTSGVPFETHYFDLVVREWVHRGGGLLDPAEQREILAAWQEDPRIGVALDLDRVVGTEPRSCADLFRALVPEVSVDPRADVLVEKTPGN